MEREYLYNIPMVCGKTLHQLMQNIDSKKVKKNINDLRGDLSLPFITSTSQALRFESEPDEVEADLFLMTFSEGQRS